ncbi:hypothetical protein FACS1894105_08500 [Clostridia bacterium]|nr:hypothetical protein FACS1894105_08500 [Clostridia bacterium]
MNEIIPFCSETKDNSLTQIGDRNTQIAHVNTVNQIFHNTAPQISISVNSPYIVQAGISVTLDTNYYSLIVKYGELFQNDFFLFDKNRTLNEYIDPEIQAKFGGLTTKSIAAIKTMPTIFALEFGYNLNGDADQAAYFGVITDIKIQENGNKIYYKKLAEISKRKLLEISRELAISCNNSGFTEFSRTHWTIKGIALLEEFAAAGIDVGFDEKGAIIDKL